MKILIDADYIVYKACAAAETEIDWGDDVIVVSSRFSDAYRLVQHEIIKIKNAFFTADDCILFFSSSSNFRKFILPEYKGHRNRKKPCGYRRVIAALEKEYEVIRMDGLEADDALGIYATLHEGNCIVSPDKDMRQIPGQLYNLDSFTLISPEQGEAWHLIQTIAGDQTDGYAGVPGYGVKRATSLLDEQGYTWDTVVSAFEEKGLTEADALVNARLARILTTEYYDFNKGKPILWTATASPRVNTGAGSKAETSDGPVRKSRRKTRGPKDTVPGSPASELLFD